jgi:peptide deformylase
MAVKPILTAEHPVLHKKAIKVSQFGDSLRRLVDDMFDSLHAVQGLGLAAPQIGVSQRVFIVDLPAEVDEEGREIAPAETYVLVNPEIVKMRGEEEMEEGCLSVPGYRGLVRRATQVVIKGQDLQGRSVRYRAEGLLAQAFQHESDHLDGILYLDRLEGPDKIWSIEVEEQAEAAESR